MRRNLTRALDFLFTDTVQGFGKALMGFSIIFSWYLFLLHPGGGPALFQHQDKLMHALCYFYLTLGCLVFFPRPQIVLIALLIQGALIEIIQPYFARNGEWLDMLSNALGLMLSWALYKKLKLGAQHGISQKNQRC
jgi:VanZ family protein